MVLQIWRNRLTSTARASPALMGPQSTKYEEAHKLHLGDRAAQRIAELVGEFLAALGNTSRPEVRATSHMHTCSWQGTALAGPDARVSCRRCSSEHNGSTLRFASSS